MNLLENIQENTCLIVPDSLKEQLLLELRQKNKFIQLKFMTFSTLKKHLFFDYDLQAVAYLMDHYKVKTEIGKEYLENMYYIEDKEYKSTKLRQLLQMKKELTSHHLLKNDPYFPYFASKYHFIIAGYAPLNRFQNKMKEMISQWTDISVIEHHDKDQKKLVAYEFNTLEEEVDFVACSILDLIMQGKSLHQMKLTNITEEYHHTLKRIFSYYHLPIDLNEEVIYATEYGKDFLEHYKKSESLEESFLFVTEKYPHESELAQALLSICNQVNLLNCSFSTKYQITENLLRQTKVPHVKPKEAIEVVPLEKEIREDEYLFLLGVNQNVFPKLYKDEDYISDYLKEEIVLDTTKEKNQITKKKAKNMIQNTRNITLTYKLKSPFESYYPSSILEELSIEIQKDPNYSKYRYSHLFNKLKLAKKLDRYRKFQEKESDLASLQTSYPNLNYLTYQNQFTGIDQEQYLQYIQHKLLLSYTSMNQYQECAFHYYLNYVLKLDPYQDTFHTFVGNLFHKLLSIAFLSNFDFEKEFNNYQKTRSFTVKEAFFLKMLKEELRNTIAIIQGQKELTKFKQELYEQEILLPIQSKIKVWFKGTIDKIMYLEEGYTTFVSVIDYKTGNASLDLFQIVHGLNMQLPVYLYLVKHSHLFSSVNFTGFYLQKILSNVKSKKEGLTQIEQKKEEMKLVGYSTSSLERLEKFDVTYQNSEWIKGMKITSKGFAHYTKIVSDEEIEQIILLTEKKIEETVSKIVSANFVINPKKIGKENVSCSYCPFSDICYHQEEDTVLLEEQHDLSFLKTGGEENG